MVPCCARSSPTQSPKCGLARHPRHPASLASTADRPTLEPTQPATGPTLDSKRDPSTHRADGQRQPNLGIPANHRGALPSRSPDRCDERLERSPRGEDRTGANSIDGFVDSVPPIAGSRCVRSSGTNRSYDDSSRSMSRTTTSTGHTAPLANSHHNQPWFYRSARERQSP